MSFSQQPVDKWYIQAQTLEMSTCVHSRARTPSAGHMYVVCFHVSTGRHTSVSEYVLHRCILYVYMWAAGVYIHIQKLVCKCMLETRHTYMQALVCEKAWLCLPICRHRCACM